MGKRVVLSVGFALVGACSATTAKPVALGSGGKGYDIECVRPDDCWAEARKACGGAYRPVRQGSANTIAESDLSGLNQRTQDNMYRPYVYSMPGGVPHYGPGIESPDPMPITEVLVVCTGT